MSDYGFTKEFRTRTTELADIAAIDRLARDLTPQRTLRRYGAGRSAEGWLARLVRWHHRPRHSISAA